MIEKQSIETNEHPSEKGSFVDSAPVGELVFRGESETQQERTPELLAPAGNWDCARAAVASGADAIYFGLQSFNARIRADNFTIDDLPDLMRYLHSHGVRGFVTMNTLIFPSEFQAAEEQLLKLAAANVDAIIVQDLGLAWLARQVAPSLELHASTQMTVTSPEGLHFLDGILQLDRVVLARELNLREIKKFDPENLPVPMEVFVHGALCVAYSVQCLTSESLGQRSANRGECAQACRMPYELVVDGETKEMGEKRYLLSPQDLAAVDLVDSLVQLGVMTFKIEGRLKSPEYVAMVTKVYRKALDAALEGKSSKEAVTSDDRYGLEMTFSRGLTTGWLEGMNHPYLTHGRFGKKRGVYLGEITDTGDGWVVLEKAAEVPLVPGDGVVFDAGEERNQEQGGRIWRMEGDRLYFHRRTKLRWNRIKKGQKLWKTDDPKLNKDIREFWSKFPSELPKEVIDMHVEGRVGEPLRLTCQGIQVESSEHLEEARQRPLEKSALQDKLGRLGNTPYTLGKLEVDLEGEVILPISALNRMRRALVSQLEAQQTPPAQISLSNPPHHKELWPKHQEAIATPEIRILCRDMEQIEVALQHEVAAIYVDFEDIRRYRDAVALVRDSAKDIPIILATPRIQKAGESGYFKVLEKAKPDGVLVRNLGALHFFRHRDDLTLIGDFSLNVANPLTARLLKDNTQLTHLTLSCDLNIQQVIDILTTSPPAWYEVLLHQHMPMFHMEHCVFCTFMSSGKDYKDCGRPCEKHKVHLRDRVGQLHILQADVGCRNTLFNGRAQTGARYFQQLAATGLSRYRIELLDEPPEDAEKILLAYKRLLQGDTDGQKLWKELGVLERLGVTEGTLGKFKLS